MTFGRAKTMSKSRKPAGLSWAGWMLAELTVSGTAGHRAPSMVEATPARGIDQFSAATHTYL